MALTAIHHGSLSTVPDTASPGLIFLRDVMAIVADLQADQSAIEPFFAADAKCYFNGAGPAAVSQVAERLNGRRGVMISFTHLGRVAWDMASEDGTRRTAIFETPNLVAFKGVEGAAAHEATMYEFAVLELELREGRWLAVEQRLFAHHSQAAKKTA